MQAVTAHASQKITYTNFTHVQEVVRSYDKTPRDLFEYQEYGMSPEGRPYMALRVNRASRDRKPQIMITAATHGDEPATTEVILGLLKKIEADYGKDPRITELVNRLDIYFIPVVSPDSFVKGFRSDGGRDPNRSYPYPGRDDHKAPTPSITALLEFFHKHDFKGSLDFHSAGEMIMHPWAYTEEPLPKEDLLVFKELTHYMAQANGYRYGSFKDLVGVAKGSSADYYFWKNRTLALGIEVGLSKFPFLVQLDPYFIEPQVESTWRFLEYVLTQTAL